MKFTSRSRFPYGKSVGYTHYFTQKREFTNHEWKLILGETKRIIAKAARGQYYTGKENAAAMSGFCKTEYRKYDAVVVSILAVARAVAPEAIEVSSDGGPKAIRYLF